MSIHNNNQKVKKELAQAYYKANQQKNKILIAAISMAVFLLYSAFSIAYGKIYSGYLVDIRGMGTLATVSLENGSEKQYQRLQELSYLTDIGIKKVAGTVSYQQKWNGNLVYLDTVAYKKLIKPAYTDIVGNYPTKENEIMLPVRVLEWMGIKEPETGIQLEFEIILSDGTKYTDTFLLSGYYTDYIDSTVNIDEIYVSKEFLIENKTDIFPADKLMAVHTDKNSGVSIEQKLSWDIKMEYDAQMVLGENPMILQKIEGMFGGLSIAVICALMVILSAYLLIYNVVSILMGKDIRQYGMLKVIGTSNQQLKSIVYRQNIKNIGAGLCIGGMAGIILVKLFLPVTLQKLFMNELGEADVSGFYPLYLLLAFLIIFLTSFFATGMAMRKVMKWNAIDSVRYTDANIIYKKKEIKSEEAISLPKFAWRNITRLKRRFFISIFSLLFACITTLAAVVITKGTDITNQIEEYPDFQMGILANISRFPDLVPETIHDDTSIMSHEMVEAVLNLEGIEKNTIDLTTGSYAVIHYGKDAALQPRKESVAEYTNEDIVFATLQIVDSDYLYELAKYIDENKLSVDIEKVFNGTGCILLHHHEMSQILQEKAADTLGLPIQFYSLSAYDKTEIDSYKKGELECAGYMDMTEKYFPKLHMTSIGNAVNYFIMTKEAFEKLGFSEKYFDISFDVSEKNETIIQQSLMRLVQNENIENKNKFSEGYGDSFYMTANSTILKTKQNEIQMTNLVSACVCLIIMMISILNYINTLMTGTASRAREFAIMESIGLTRIQLWKMLFMEGVYYWLIIMSGLLTLGTGSVWILGKIIKRKLLYFKFIYPWELIISFAVILFVLCFVIFSMIYRKDQKQGLADKLRSYAD